MKKTEQTSPMSNEVVDMFSCLQTMDADRRRHFIALCGRLVTAFADDAKTNALLLMRHEDGELFIATANASEGDVVEMLADAGEAVYELATEDAPPKDRLN